MRCNSFGNLNLTSRPNDLQVTQYEITINTIDQLSLGSMQSQLPYSSGSNPLAPLVWCFLRRLCKRYDTVLLTNERPGGEELPRIVTECPAYTSALLSAHSSSTASANSLNVTNLHPYPTFPFSMDSLISPSLPHLILSLTIQTVLNPNSFAGA